MSDTPVRVMRKTPEELSQGAAATVAAAQAAETLTTFYVNLSDGREVVLREMMASDLLFVEKLASAGDMERSLKLAARLSTGSGKISYDDLQKLKMKDLRKVTDLLSKAGDTGEEDDEDPNV